MTTWLLSVILFLVIFLAMSIGVIHGRMPIKGSCGGIGNKCAACSRPCQKVKDKQ